MVRRWLDRYDRWHDGSLEAAPRRGRKLVLSFSFPPRKLLPTEYVSYLSLVGYSLSQGLLFVLTSSLVVVVGVVVLAVHFTAHAVATHYPHAPHHAQQKLVVLLLKVLLRRGHGYIVGFIWEQVEASLILSAFVFSLYFGKLRAWNRRARRLRLTPDVAAPPLPTPPGVWPPSPTP